MFLAGGALCSASAQLWKERGPLVHWILQDSKGCVEEQQNQEMLLDRPALCRFKLAKVGAACAAVAAG